MLDLIHAYENYLTKVKKASANTIGSYMRDIRQFAEWLNGFTKKNVLDVEGVTVPVYYAGDCSGERTASIAEAIRGGYKNKPFYIMKFRSMVVDADKTGGCTAKDDPRVTRSGRISV